MLLSHMPSSMRLAESHQSAIDTCDLTRKRFEIAELVGQGELELARQQAQWCLSLYPESQDILVIHALVCEMQHDWDSASKSLEKLVHIQQPQVSEETWHHLIRVQRCQGEMSKALSSAYHALRHFPASVAINQEFDSICTLIPNVA